MRSGRPCCPTSTGSEAVWSGGGASGRGLLKLLEKVIGLELKMRQYEQGKRFCDAVVAEGGIEALNRAWASPQALPTQAELDDPKSWLARAA